MYTCTHGQQTILHPTTYDVCVRCFVAYAVDGQSDELPSERRLLSDGAAAALDDAESSGSRSDDDDGQEDGSGSEASSTSRPGA